MPSCLSVCAREEEEGESDRKRKRERTLLLFFHWLFYAWTSKSAFHTWHPWIHIIAPQQQRKVGIPQRTTSGHSQPLTPNTDQPPSCPAKVKLTKKSLGAPSNRSASHWLPPQLGTTSSCRGLLAKHRPKRPNCDGRANITEPSSRVMVSRWQTVIFISLKNDEVIELLSTRWDQSWV